MAKHLWGVSRTGAAPALKALRFPSNVSGSDTAAPYAVIQYANPHLNGLPLWGPSNLGVTVFRRYRPTQQTGYYAAFWYTDDDSFSESANAFWGFHPYPTNGANSGTSHWWEIAIDSGDYVDARSGAHGVSVTKDVWYTQALKVVRNNANSKTLTFYTNLPSVADADVVEMTCGTSNYGETPAAQPMLTIGDSPWYSLFQHERASGDIAEQMIIAKAMSEADIATQGASLQTLSTADSIANIWWGKKTYTSVDDLTCDFGTGRSFTRNDSSNLLSLVDV